MIWQLASRIVVLGIAVSGVEPPPAVRDGSKPGAVASSRSTFDARLEEIDARVAKVDDLVAEFEQVKSTPLLKKPLTSTGHIAVKGDRVRWDTREPRRSITAIADGEIRIYYPSERTAEVYSTEGDLRQLSGTPLPRLSWLRAHFDLAELDPQKMGVNPEHKEGLVAVVLTPKDAGMKEHVTTVQVLLDSSVPCVRRLELFSPDAHSTSITLSNIRVNTGLRTDDVTLTIPDGVRVSNPLRKDPPDGGGATPQRPTSEGSKQPEGAGRPSGPTGPHP